MMRVFISASLLVACAAVRSHVREVVRDVAQLPTSQMQREAASATTEPEPNVVRDFRSGHKGFVYEEDMTVSCVDQGGAADEHGVLPGDKLVEVNTRRVGPEDILGDLSDPATLGFFRGQPELESCSFSAHLERKPVGFELTPHDMVVSHVEPGSAAESASVRPGDELIMVDGNCVIPAEFESVAQHLEEATSPVTLKFLRPYSGRPYFEVKFQPGFKGLHLRRDMVLTQTEGAAHFRFVRPGDMMISVNGHCKFPEDYDAVIKDLGGPSTVNVGFVRHVEPAYERSVQANDVDQDWARGYGRDVVDQDTVKVELPEALQRSWLSRWTAWRWF